MEKFLQVAPHSLALVLGRRRVEEESPEEHHRRQQQQLQQPQRGGYEVFANFKEVNMQHFWNSALTYALTEVFFLGWIHERVLLIQGEEANLEVLRSGWMRRTLAPPRGFEIKCIGG
ncbi:unnamed protein product [Knipowitschia caucasica]|uniref:Storkhead-box protein 1 n=1 Tax=Knipowitschia caucasica TaxID=637954 RepID=A0AAV2LID2_KNICA